MIPVERKTAHTAASLRAHHREIQISRINQRGGIRLLAFLRGRNRAVKLSLNAFRPQQTECTERFHTFGILVIRVESGRIALHIGADQRVNRINCSEKNAGIKILVHQLLQIGVIPFQIFRNGKQL